MAEIPGPRTCKMLTTGAALACVVVMMAGSSASAITHATAATPRSRECPPQGVALGYSDALDKLSHGGVEVGGLSSLAFDRRSRAWVSAVDNHGTDPARLWFLRDLANPTIVRDPLVLRRPDGTPYDGTTADDEGVAVLPDGDFLVSSETEPSIRIFGRDGRQRASLPVPATFAVTGTSPDGQATSNATLEGLTITPSGRRIVAAMEGALSGDVSATGDATLHRFLVYDGNGHTQWRLTRQVAYRTDPGMRIPEVAAYAENALLVEEASFSVATGNTVSLFSVPDLNDAPDVSSVPDLSQAPDRDVIGKRLVADLVHCPTLSAPAKETQSNPLLDNYEGMAITSMRHRHSRHRAGSLRVSLISDDNFSATQTTRILNLAIHVPIPG